MKSEKCEIEKIKSQILKDRLKNVLLKNPKKISKILSFLIKRSKNV